MGVSTKDDVANYARILAGKGYSVMTMPSSGCASNCNCESEYGHRQTDSEGLAMRAAIYDLGAVRQDPLGGAGALEK